MQVIIPDNHTNEREYIVGVVLKDFLGLTFHLKTLNIRDYVLILDNGSQIVIRDSFFSQHLNGDTYLNCRNLPGKAVFGYNRFLVEKDIPIVYGDTECSVQDRTVLLGIDLFASVFFLLTRWEEYVIRERDQYGRFPVDKAFISKNGLLLRPLVNEYIEMLWNILLFLSHNIKRRERRFTIVPTHDIDRYYEKRIAAAKGTPPKGLKQNAVRMYYNLFNVDPCAAFHYLMDVSERSSVQSHFYFMAGGCTRYEGYYRIQDASIRKIIREVQSRNHIIGFHPSYDSFNDCFMWTEEKKDLELAIGQEVTEGRQHYLRYEIPRSAASWEKNGMQIDSSLGLPEAVGFRCGTGDEYYLFDILRRQRMKLKERPLIIMDSALRKVVGGESEKTQTVALVKEISRKYNMPLTILFHNHSLDNTPWNRERGIYETLMQKP